MLGDTVLIVTVQHEASAFDEELGKFGASSANVCVECDVGGIFDGLVAGGGSERIAGEAIDGEFTFAIFEEVLLRPSGEHVAGDRCHRCLTDRGDDGGLVDGVVAEAADLAQGHRGHGLGVCGRGDGCDCGEFEGAFCQTHGRVMAVGNVDVMHGERLHRPRFVRAASVGLHGDAMRPPQFGEESRRPTLAVEDQDEAMPIRVGGEFGVTRLVRNFTQQARNDGRAQVVEHAFVAERCHHEEGRAIAIVDPVVHQRAYTEPITRGESPRQFGLTAGVAAHMPIDIEHTGQRLVVAHPIG